jgi:hypothetical protein
LTFFIPLLLTSNPQQVTLALTQYTPRVDQPGSSSSISCLDHSSSLVTDLSVSALCLFFQFCSQRASECYVVNKIRLSLCSKSFCGSSYSQWWVTKPVPFCWLNWPSCYSLTIRHTLVLALLSA